MAARDFPRSPRLLVSVRSVRESVDAFAGGADIVDLKEPRNGSLGAVSSEVAQDVCDVLASSALETRRGNVPPLSLAMGELSQWNPSRQKKSPEFPSQLLERFTYAKIGLAGCDKLDWQPRWMEWSAALPENVNPVLVIYADWRLASAPSVSEVLHFATKRYSQSKILCKSAAGAAAITSNYRRLGGILLDTWRKGAGRLFDVMTEAETSRLIKSIRSLGVWAAVAGSLDSEAIAQAAFMNPDVVAVRGAVCGGVRTDAVQRELVNRLRRQLDSLDPIATPSRIGGK